MLYPVVCVVNFVAMIASFAINGLAGSGPDGTIFKNTTGDLSDYFALEITPAGWTFSIWGIIYTWQTLWVLYSLVNICRKGASGQPAYADPEFLPSIVPILATVTSALGIAWLISFDRLEIEVSFVSLLLYALLMYAQLAFAYRAVDKASPFLAQQGRTREIWLTRGLVHNGLAILATWVTVAMLLNLAMVLIYGGDKLLNIKDASTVSLAVLAFLIVAFAVSDLIFLDRYSRYTLTPYAVLVIALSGSLAKNYEEGARNSVFTVILLAVAAALAVIKISLTVYRHLKLPRYPTSMEPTTAGYRKGGQLA